MVNYGGPNVATSEYTRVLEVACKEEFFQLYESAMWKDAAYKTLCENTSSDGDTEYYGFGGALPFPTRIDNETRNHYGFDDESYTLQNYTYGVAIDIHRKIMEDDRHGFVKQKFAAAAMAHQLYMEENFVAMVELGTSTACHDGQYYFDTDHTSSQDNDDQNVAVITSDIASSMTNALAVTQTMKDFNDPNGKPLNINPTHVFTGNGDTSVAWDMIINTGTAWYLFDLSKPYKPFIFQTRYGLEVKTEPPDAKCDNFVTSTYERYRYGYGPWYLSIIGNL
jgi:phage major head subunit gpT-like protein